MELVAFSMVALLVTGVFVTLRTARLAAGRWWRWAGTAASVACGGAMVAAVVLALRRVDVLMSSRTAGMEPEPLAGTFARMAALQDLWLLDTLLFVVLGVVQGAALGLALSVITEPGAPAVNGASHLEAWRAASRVEAWRAALGKAVVMLPLPAALAMLLAFYQDNRQRFSSVQVGGFLTLALSPAPTSGSQQSTGQDPSGGGLLYSTDVFVDRARGSLNGELRRRDQDLIAALGKGRREARMPNNKDFEYTLFVEGVHCNWLDSLREYVRHFDDYNLLTLDIGDALSRLQIAWEIDVKELDLWAKRINPNDLSMSLDEAHNKIMRHENVAHLEASATIFDNLNRKARDALIRIGEGGAAASRAQKPPCAQPRRDDAAPQPAAEAQAKADLSGSDAPNTQGSQTATSAGPADADPASVGPRRWTADETRSRVLDLHAPYRAIGIANFYAAIGSFETAYLVLRKWLALDNSLRQASPQLRDALPRWFRLRVLSEAAEMYKNTSQDARLSERYRRQLQEVVDLYRELVDKLPAECSKEAAAAETPDFDAIDPVAALALARVTSEIEFFEVSGLSGAASQRHVDDAKKLTELYFSCFEHAFALSKNLPEGGSSAEQTRAVSERRVAFQREVRAALQLYQTRAFVAWGRLAVRWAEAGRTLKRVSDAERKAMLGEVRVKVGGAVERLEHRARAEEAQRANEAAPNRRAAGTRAYVESEATLDHARVARRVLQEALALDQ